MNEIILTKIKFQLKLNIKDIYTVLTNYFILLLMQRFSLIFKVFVHIEYVYIHILFRYI